MGGGQEEFIGVFRYQKMFFLVSLLIQLFIQLNSETCTSSCFGIDSEPNQVYLGSCMLGHSTIQHRILQIRAILLVRKTADGLPNRKTWSRLVATEADKAMYCTCFGLKQK